MKHPSYSSACDWIAANDESGSRSVAFMKDLISVLMVADLFGVVPEIVARDVIKRRGGGIDG